jgi:hypothetical protein
VAARIGGGCASTEDAMASPRVLHDDRDYRRGMRDGRMDALLARTGAQAPEGASEAYRAGYAEGTATVRPAVHHAA